MTAHEEFLDIEEFARKTHYSVRQIRQYCIDGKIKGASKLTDDARKWLIPASALQQKLEPQTDLKMQETRIHDREIFENSDKILNESAFENIFEFLSRNSSLRSHQYKLFKFLKYFKMESNKYGDWHLNYVCQELCNNLKELLSYIENDSVERNLVLSFYDKYRENSIENEYTRFLNKLCADTSDLHSPELDELYLIMSDESVMWLDLHNQPELSDNFNSEHSWEFQMELSQLVDNARSAHKTYRAAVRETLLI